jgi:hypothetical protein
VEVEVMYNYNTEKRAIFTEAGQRQFLGIRDEVKRILDMSGAITMGCAMRTPKGVPCSTSWTAMACVDRMVELGEIREIPTDGAGQHRIFVSV